MNKDPLSVLDFSRQTILLVDDDEDDAFLMQTVFRKLNITNPLQRVADGEEAIGYFEGRGPYQDRSKYPLPVVVLLDLNMPRRNGFEVLAWLRTHPVFGKVTVHILSASMRQVDVEEAFALGANSYLVKPSQLEGLLELFASWHCVARHSGFATLAAADATRH